MSDNVVLSLCDKFPLRVMHMPDQRERPMHAHEFTELVIITDGESKHITQSDTCRIGAGDVFISPKISHGYRCSGNCGCSLINVMFHFDKLELPYFDLRKSSVFRMLFELEPSSGSLRRSTQRRHLHLTQTALTETLTMLERLISALN